MIFSVDAQWVPRPGVPSPHWYCVGAELSRISSLPANAVVSAALREMFDWDSWLPEDPPFESLTIRYEPIEASSGDRFESFGPHLWVTVWLDAATVSSTEGTTILGDLIAAALSGIRAVCERYGLPEPAIATDTIHPGASRRGTSVDELWVAAPESATVAAITRDYGPRLELPARWVSIRSEVIARRGESVEWFEVDLSGDGGPANPEVAFGDLMPGRFSVEQLTVPRSTVLGLVIRFPSRLGRGGRLAVVSAVVREVEEAAGVFFTSCGRERETVWAMFHSARRLPIPSEFALIDEYV